MTKSLKLLYIEDDHLTQSATMEILSPLFGEVLVASNGKEGLELYRSASPDLIITDLLMPVMNGLEMISIIREHDHNTPIVVCSANDESQYFIQSIRFGVNGYALKPIDITSCLNTLKLVTEALYLKRTVDMQKVLMEQYMEVTNKSSIVSKTNPDGFITYVNDLFCEFTGYSCDELLGQSHHMFSHPDMDKKIYSDLWYTIKTEKKMFQGILKNINKQGKTYYSKTTIIPLFGVNSEINEFIALHSDVTEMMRPSQQLHDYLQTCGTNPTIVLIKIEGFNHLETFFGNRAGEAIEEAFIQQFFEKLSSLTDQARIFAIGGGNVVIATGVCDPIQLTDNLKQLQENIYKSVVDIQGIEYDVAVIISFSNGKNALEDARSGINYLEKTSNHFINAYGFYEQMKIEAKQNLDMLQQIKHALDNQRIISYFQPIVDNESGEIVKYESLVRMIDDDHNILTPYYFLEISKKGKFYSRITQMVIQHSFEALSRTTKKISINLSIQDIEREDTRTMIYKTLELHKDQASRVVFELLEDETIGDLRTVKTFIQQVKTYGIKIAIDDFGSGYSNYQRLMEYQPDILKIDGSLIKTVHKDPYVQSVVESIIRFARENNMKTLAEFVEDESVYNFVKALGIDYSQGYYFGKPESIESVV
ncbi:EAL domain-containing protein [bacterium]|nr:EAL domain-containing protein [bacterium]